jgi:hypothetical protein
MENIIEKLKRLKDVQPDKEYSQRSKLVILAAPKSFKEQNPVFKVGENIIETLKKLAQIQPDAAYSRLSKLALLGAPALAIKRRPIFNWQVAFSLAGLLLVLITGNMMHNLRPSAPNLNTLTLETELKELNIDIQLAKIEYSQKVNETVSLALKEISQKQTNHLNPIILESEQTQLNAESSVDNQNQEEIDNLLEQVLL